MRLKRNSPERPEEMLVILNEQLLGRSNEDKEGKLLKEEVR